MKPKAYSYSRFSSPSQEEGDSLRRQTQYAEKWCRENGYTLDESLKMQDKGLSAFTGKHISEGALGQFVDLVEKGEVEKGSVLIVEALDRLSREKFWPAKKLFDCLIEAGIKLVLSEDGKAFTYESIEENPREYNDGLNDLILAHKESSRKSKRLKATWEQKRANTHKEVLTGRCPAWLKRSEDWTEYHKINGHWQVIEKIFQMKLSGKSPRGIAKELNQTPGIWKPKNGWRNSYLNKIIRSRAVIGEYQPHKMIDGKRQPVGDPLLNYFPVIVSPDIFYAVQEQLRKNGKHYHGGRTGKVRNLFSHVTKCGYCGGAVHFINKGTASKGGSYLVCDNGKRKNGCKYISWRYDEFEKDLLRYVSMDINLSQLLPDHEQVESEINILQREKSSIKGQLHKVESEIENLSDTISTTADKRIRSLLESKLTGKLDEKENFEKQFTEVETKIHDLKRINGNLQERISNLKELFETMQDLKDKDEDALIDIRFRLRQMLRNLIERIDIYPGGFKNVAQVKELHPAHKIKIYAEGIDNKEFRFYEVQLKGCKSFKRGWYPPGTHKKLEALDLKRQKEHGGFSRTRKGIK